MKCQLFKSWKPALSLLIIIAVLSLAMSGCETITKSTVSVAPSVEELQPKVYAILPVQSAPTPEGQKWQNIQEQGPESIMTMLIAGLVDVLPIIVDRSRVDSLLKEIKFQNLSGLTEEQTTTIGKMLNADAIISVYLGEYNASRVSISATSSHVQTGAVLWSADVTVKVGWISLDTESAAERAVDDIIRKLKRDFQ